MAVQGQAMAKHLWTSLALETPQGQKSAVSGRDSPLLPPQQEWHMLDTEHFLQLKGGSEGCSSQDRRKAPPPRITPVPWQLTHVMQLKLRCHLQVQDWCVPEGPGHQQALVLQLLQTDPQLAREAAESPVSTRSHDS